MYSEILDALESEEGNSPSHKSFYATGKLTPEDFQVEVKNVGKVPFPLDQATLQRLKDIFEKKNPGIDALAKSL